MFSGDRVATTKTVTFDGIMRKTNYARAGIYLHSSAYTAPGDKSYSTYFPTNMFQKGVYIGIGREKKYLWNLVKRQDNKESKFAAGNAILWYADIMLLPTSVISIPNTSGWGAGAPKTSTGLIGARAGLKWYRNPYTSKQNFNNKLGTMGRFFWNQVAFLEAGMRPLDGFYFSAGRCLYDKKIRVIDVAKVMKDGKIHLYRCVG